MTFGHSKKGGVLKMENNATDYNADSSGQGGYSDNSGSGDQGNGSQTANADGSQGQSGTQGGGTPDPRDTEIARLRNEVRTLNKGMVDAKRGNRQNNFQQQNNQQDQGDPFGSPEGKYAVSLQLATGELRNKLENVFDMYKELEPADAARIRKNPWAFASHDSYISADYETAVTEIEQTIFDQLVQAGKIDQNGNPIQQQNQNNGGQGTTVPATVNNNPNAEVQAPAAPGSQEDNDPWTMPMEKLEKVKNAEIANLKKKS